MMAPRQRRPPVTRRHPAGNVPRLPVTLIDLPPREYALLEYLMRHAGQALSRTMILDRVWEYGFDSFANVVDAAILRLRKAVDEGYDQQLIQTVRGVGYRIKA